MEKTSKLKSVKLWVTIWAMALLTYIVVADRADFLQIGMILSAAPMTYTVCNVKQKEIFNKLADTSKGDK